MELLKFSTAGSVDDGKSTLIGRLLYDTNSLTTDQIQAVEAASKRKGFDYLDLSLLTDGLSAEREQGITIDVAHIYFQTNQRKFIIADTPGHVEYTRNMVTGSSNSQLSIILIDARKGVIEQTHRHFFIANLLRIPEVVVCVNKMDLVDYSEDVFSNIRLEFLDFIKGFDSLHQRITFIAASSLKGDNIVNRTETMKWYEGPTLLEYLETVEVNQDINKSDARFPVQYVVRPHSKEHHDYRGYAGRVVSGSFAVGDEVTVLPSGLSSKIKQIVTFDGEFLQTEPSSSVTLLLENEIDVTRGNLIAKSENLPSAEKEFTAQICWMDTNASISGGKYIIQHSNNRVKAIIKNVDYIVNTSTLEKDTGRKWLKLNDIAEVQIKTASPLFFDSYERNKANGSFIIIDEGTKSTVAAGVIL
ncbi:sulfate adenylyltransferase subunit 1 [Solitalea koreensis]|uniref:sulfate adenylyltransferase n=1 Tax=Solitalea koreensis TaxID=543615 RepID=A0A521D899_9SPHI|nr:GTP-binding protein [Solitalea koreensis]SMO67919.1 sulfate adenylyltransferase subunit 1 [Solitalea koreensis]